jgi:hypothetical protein
MTVSEIAIAAVAALVVMMAALVMILSISDREGRLPPEPRHARYPAAPPTGQVPRPRAEHPGPFGENNERYAGPAGYGRQPGYGPPPLWGDDPH